MNSYKANIPSSAPLKMLASLFTSVLCLNLFISFSFPTPFRSCWDMNDNTALWWVIKGPVVGSIMVSSTWRRLAAPDSKLNWAPNKYGSWHLMSCLAYWTLVPASGHAEFLSILQWECQQGLCWLLWEYKQPTSDAVLLFLTIWTTI